MYLGITVVILGIAFFASRGKIESYLVTEITELAKEHGVRLNIDSFSISFVAAHAEDVSFSYQDRGVLLFGTVDALITL